MSDGRDFGLLSLSWLSSCYVVVLHHHKFIICGLKSSDLKSLKHNKQQKTSQFGMFTLFNCLILFGGLLHLNHTLMS